MEPQIEMRQHFQSGKVHAFLPEQERSLCEYTSRKATGVGSGLVCLICQSIMQDRKLVPTPTPAPVLEEMLVEFAGGRFDGEKMWVLIEITDAARFRLLERKYRIQERTKASAVEQAAGT